ncbi:glucose 1-dehydrogenase [Zwartia sp.]|uniref:glucose 1-dehydrogenase n=1 Tax=Zwartia sp. TaxID=2978004 RepID=UPI003BB1CD9F
MRLKNQVAIVTGAASGFGAEIARSFVREGARVVIADLNEAGAQKVAAEIGQAAVAVKCDVSQRADIDRAVKMAREHFGEIDIVVNNAGFTHKNQPFLDVDEATYDRCFDVNVKAIYHMINAVVPAMRAKKSGCIINIGSTAGLRPRPGLTWYNASKGAANLLSKSLAVELAGDNIRVNVICPVMGDTGMLGDFMGIPDTPENRARFIATIPMGRLSVPKDIANAAVFLASDEASFLTGLELPVDGGRTI